MDHPVEDPTASVADRTRSIEDVGPLDGLLERNGFHPALSAGSALVAGFLAFQVLSAIVAAVLILTSGGLAGLSGLDVGDLIGRYARELLVANTVGQVVGLALFSWLLARLHTRNAAGFLRLRPAGLGFTVLSVVGLLLLVPAVQWLGAGSDALPWPRPIRDWESTQLDLIERVLNQDLGLGFAIVTLAVTPAFCEELFFRGYIQRQADRFLGGWMAVVVFSGVVFGLYHLRPTQALPLSVLGMYLAYVTWRSGSIVPAILVHFANNALAAGLGAYVSSRPDLAPADLENLSIPAYITVPATLLFAGVAWVLHTRFRRPADRQPE